MKNSKDCDCKNCQHIEKQKRIILSSVRPIGKGIDDHMVNMWNESLRLFPCLKK